MAAATKQERKIKAITLIFVLEKLASKANKGGLYFCLIRKQIFQSWRQIKHGHYDTVYGRGMPAIIRSFVERFNFPSKLSVIYDTTFEFTAQEKEEKF